MTPCTRPLFRWLAALAFAVITGLVSSASATPLNVVASFSLLGDMTRRIGGARIRVHTLVGEDADAHVYQPTPADAKTIAQAVLVVTNGLGFEGWIERLIKSSGYRGKVLAASSGVHTIKRSGMGDAGHSRAAHKADADPHAWQDLVNALRYVDNIAQALAEADPAGKVDYQTNAAQYKEDIRALDAEIRALLASIPASRRKVVTTHDAFSYFARAYGVEFLSPVGINTESEPSAAAVGRIIRQIRREHISAIFLESVSDPRLLERIRQESGAKIGGVLYADSLSKRDGPAASYLELMRHNAKTLAEALAQ